MKKPNVFKDLEAAMLAGESESQIEERVRELSSKDRGDIDRWLLHSGLLGTVKPGPQIPRIAQAVSLSIDEVE